MSLLQEIEQHGLADCEFNRKLAIENIAELAEQIYFEVLDQLCLDSFKDGFIEPNGQNGTKNTERGSNLYYAIEQILEDYLKVNL
jgi:hypothetical protein